MPTDQSIADAELLRAYTDEHSSTAFSELAQRYLPLIYSAALRQARDPHLAEDIAQAVLIILSQKARSIDPAFLPGWLIKTTHFASGNALRKLRRQRSHEEKAASMKDETSRDDHREAQAISSEIDFALAHLGDKDRTLVIQRFFQNRSFSEIASDFASTESAIQRRVIRALDKLRATLSRRGTTIAPAALPVALFAQKLHSPPATLAQIPTATGAATTSATLIAKSTLSTFAVAKAKLTAAILIPILLIGISAPAIYHVTTRGNFTPTPISGSLPPGVTATIVAIKHLPDGKWLAPSGQGAPQLPFDPDTLIANEHGGIKNLRLAVIMRFTNQDASIDTTTFLDEHGGTSIVSTSSLADHANYSLYQLAPKAGQREVTFSVASAIEPWRSVIIPNKASFVDAAITVIQNRTISFGSITEKNHHAQITKRGYDSDLEWWLTAQDKTGNTFYISGSRGLSPDVTYTFEKPLDDIQQILYKARPYTYHAQFAPIPF